MVLIAAATPSVASCEGVLAHAGCACKAACTEAPGIDFFMHAPCAMAILLHMLQGHRLQLPQGCRQPGTFIAWEQRTRIRMKQLSEKVDYMSYQLILCRTNARFQKSLITFSLVA